MLFAINAGTNGVSCIHNLQVSGNRKATRVFRLDSDPDKRERQAIVDLNGRSAIVSETVDRIPRLLRIAYDQRIHRISSRRRVKVWPTEEQARHWRRSFAGHIVGFDPLAGIAQGCDSVSKIK